MKRALYIFTFIIFLFPVITFAQRIPDLDLTSRVVVNKTDETIYTHVNSDKPNFTPKISNTYFWFSAGQIKSTQGGYSGKLLDGGYESFYPDKTLKEKGAFKNGLKDGEWRKWYPSGNLKEIKYWNKGKDEEKFIILDEQGRKLKEGRMKNKLFYGETYEYLPNDSVSVTKYQKGEAVRKKESLIKNKFKYYYKRLFGKKENTKVINASTQLN